VYFEEVQKEKKKFKKLKKKKKLIVLSTQSNLQCPRPQRMAHGFMSINQYTFELLHRHLINNKREAESTNQIKTKTKTKYHKHKKKISIGHLTNNLTTPGRQCKHKNTPL
jgi:hypothetical protein